MSLNVATEIEQEAFDDFLSARCEPQWLTAVRREAWKAFCEMPLPDRQQDEWRRTDIRGFRFDKFGLPGPEKPEAAMPSPLLTQNVDLAGSTASLDSRPGLSRMATSLAAKGVLFGSLDDLVLQHSERLKPWLTAQVVDPRYDKFAAISSACWSGGMVLHVPRGVVIHRPLHMFSAMSAGGVDFGRTLIVLDQGAEATVLAETAGGDPKAGGLHCGTVEICLGRGAKLQYISLQNWSEGVWHFAHQKAMVGSDASLQWTIGSLGGRLVKVNQHVALVGEGANAQVNGVLFTDNRQHVCYHTLQHHEAAHGTSDLLYKGALQGNSYLVWRGMVKVDRDAQKTDGYQRNDNLVLSESARADSIPGLEIEADDVKCSHGATVGRVDDEQVFYAQARGLSRKEAVRLIVAGFFQQVFDRIAIAGVRRALSQAIGQRIHDYS
jgi:Fe-S cluster assembly protein SufD